MPDYYSITLEISRDRTTSARQVTCVEKSSCPSSADVGDTFLRRDINTACHKMVRARICIQGGALKSTKYVLCVGQIGKQFSKTISLNLCSETWSC